MIFGWDKPYEELLEEANIPTLKERRERKIASFAMRAEASEIFKDRWFTLNDHVPCTRKQNKYQVETCKSFKQSRNPVHYYTCLLNRNYRL